MFPWSNRMSTMNNNRTLRGVLQELGNVYQLNITLPTIFREQMNISDYKKQEVEERIKLLVTRIILTVKREPTEKKKRSVA